MKKLFSLLFCIILAAATYAHNPLQGTKWVLNDEKGNTTFTIEFETASVGYLTAGEQSCGFMYGATHTDLFIKINKCEPEHGKSGIIPYEGQQTIPMRTDEKGNLILVINEKEYVLNPAK